MVQDGYWLLPHHQWDGVLWQPYVQKPPLVTWLQGISMTAFGVNTVSARLPSFLATLVLVLTVYYIGTTVADEWTGIAAGAAFLFLPPTYQGSHSLHTANLDALLVCFGTLFVWWTWQSRHEKFWLLPAGIAAGLAFLAKGFAAGIYLIVLLPVGVVYWRAYLTRRTIAAVGAAGAVVAPWVLYAWYSLDGFFVREFIGRVGARISGNFARYGDPVFSFMNYPYFKYLPEYFGHAAVLVAIAFGYGIWQAFTGTERRPLWLFLMWWSTIFPVAFAILGGNHGWYLHPMLPPIAVLLGLATSQVFKTARDTARTVVTLPESVLAVSLGVLVVSLSVVAIPAPPSDPHQKDQAILGGGVHEDVPSDAEVYIQEAVLNSKRPYVFNFYAERDVEVFHVGGDSNAPYRVHSRDSISTAEYALVRPDFAKSTGRNTTTIRRFPDQHAVLIRFS